MTKIIIVLLPLFFSGCLAIHKASCHLSHKEVSVLECKRLWELDYALNCNSENKSCQQSMNRSRRFQIRKPK